MNQSKDGAEMAFIRASALDELGRTTDEELLKEVAEDGRDAGDIGVKLRAHLGDVAAAAMRAKLAEARERMNAEPAPGLVRRLLPSIERAREMVQAAFRANPKLAVAFRDGKAQSDNDLMSLYENLVRTGDIVPDDDGR